MYTNTTTLDVLFVTAGTADGSAASDSFDFETDAVSVTVATDAGEAAETLRSDPVDCVLCTDSSGGRDCLALVRTLRSEFPSVPTVVFAGGADDSLVSDLLRDGATDVIRSPPAETPAALVSARVKNATDAEGRAVRTGALERYETILNTAGDAIYQLDAEGTILAVNDAAVDLTGYDRPELVGEHVSKLVSESDIAEAERLIRRQLGREGGAVDTIELSVRTEDGETVPCETRIAVVDIDGEMDGSVGVARDVTEKREREQELRDRDELLGHIAESVSDVVWVTTADKDAMEFVSEAYEDVWGRPREELYENSRAFLEGVHPDDRQRVERAVARQQTDPDSYDETYRVVQPDGEIRYVRDRAFGVYDDDANLTRIVGVARDITERREAQTQLEAERDMFAQGPAVVFKWRNAEGWPVEYVSENVTDLLGYTPEQLTSGEMSYAELVHEEDVDRVTAEVDDNPDGTTERFSHEPYRLVTSNGDSVWVKDTTKVVREQGEITHYLGYLVDITERKEREAKIASQRDELAQLDRINRIIRDIDQALVGADSRAEIEQAVCDRLTAAGRYGFALALRQRGTDELVAHASTETGASFAEDVFPAENLDPETSPGLRALRENEVEVVQSIREWIDDERWSDAIDDAGVESLAAIPVTYQGTEYGVIVVYGEEEEAFSRREQAVLSELGETVGYAIAAAERREREQILTALYEATQDLLGADSRTDVCEVVVETAAEVLGPPGIGIFLFDDGENVLEPAVATDELLSYYGDATVFGSGNGDSAVWESYVSGETRFYSDVRDADRVANPETDARSTLVIPLGDHGAFVAASTETDGFDERMRQLVGLLAATTEAALDRVAGRVSIQERDRQLAARSERLGRVERVLDCLRDVNQLLIGAATRDEIESGICERLTEMEPYGFAWIGTVPPDGTVVEPRTWAGIEEAYLDAVSFDIDSTEPAATTAATGTPTVIENVSDHLREGSWAGDAIDRGFESIATVPLVYGETTYGVLGLYATDLEAFEEPVAGVLAELGHLIAYSINGVETTRGILSERLTELELRIEARDTFLNAVATVADETVFFREILPEEGGTARVLFALDDPPIEEILTLQEEFVAVEALSHIDATDEHIFRATLGGKTVAATLLKCGGLPQEVVASAEDTRVVVRIPQELDVRVYLDRVRESYPETTLVSRRTVDSGPTEHDIDATLAANLTERQREVLLTAYRCGFFESPRETTGAELAELLDISQPTLTHHLREAQRRLFEAMYEPSDDRSRALDN